MNIQGFLKLTLLDYPQKTACTVFTGGCNLRCPFCHNASLVKNPTEQENKTDEVLDYLKKRTGILDGVCITGGEPLLQPDLKDFIKAVKELGFLVKLDTNGTLPKRLKEVIGLVDYVAMDIKASFDNYPNATYCDIDRSVYEESINIIKNSGIDHEFRTTCVKGIHTIKDFTQIGELLKGEKKYFIQGFVDSGNLLESGQAFSKDEMLEFLNEIKKYIPEAELRGEDKR